ncbi:MAG: histidine triad family protein [Actinomycetota bacterium]
MATDPLAKREWKLLDDVRAGATHDELRAKWDMDERELRVFLATVGEKLRIAASLLAATAEPDGSHPPGLRVPPMEPCPFCQNIDGTYAPDRAPAVVFEDDLVYIFLTRGPLGGLAGHALVCPKRHAPTILDLTQDEAAALGQAVARTARAVHDFVNPHGLLVQQNNGVAAFQTVPHVHFHVIPKTVGPFPPLEPPPQIPDDELLATAASLRERWVATG